MCIRDSKSGIPIVIAGDDPGSFGSNELTVDYYMVFMSWGLSLYDLREIANNSIRYSSMSETIKATGFSKFQNNWSSFINTMYAQICSNASMNPSLTLNMTGVYPSYGPNDTSIDITIYGYGYENLLCKQILCYFNQTVTNGYLIKLHELVCPTPVGFSDNTYASLSVGYGSSIVATGLNFKFAYLPSAPVSMGVSVLQQTRKYDFVLFLIISLLF